MLGLARNATYLRENEHVDNLIANNTALHVLEQDLVFTVEFVRKRLTDSTNDEISDLNALEQWIESQSNTN